MDRLVVRVIATGKDELAQLQTARRLSRRAFARYTIESLGSTRQKNELLEYARDNEKLLDAEVRGNAMIYEVSFPIQKIPKKPKGK